MPRQILAEDEARTEEQISEDTIPQGKAILQNSLNAASNECSIRQEEMEKLLNEWTFLGKGDLIVDSTMADRLRKYIAYQEELDPLREQLANRLYSKFSCEIERASDSLEVKVYVDGQDEGFYVSIACRTQSESKTYIRLNDFKKILASMKNPYAQYIPEDNRNTRVNIFAFLKSIGASVNWDSYGLKITTNQ